MITQRAKIAWTGLCLLMAAAQVQAFGGSIAVGMGRIDGSEELDVSFSATTTLTADGSTVEGTTHYRPGMLRDELTVEGSSMIIIQRYDLQKLWTLMPQGMYMETDIEEATEQQRAYELIEHEQVGSESVNGMTTTKYKTVWKYGDHQYTGYSWTTHDGITVRSVMYEDGAGGGEEMRFEITSLERGPQSAELFEIPAGYRKMNLGAMGSMFGGGRPGGSAAPGAAAAPGGPEAGSPADAKSGGEESGAGVGERVRQGLRGLFNRD